MEQEFVTLPRGVVEQALEAMKWAFPNSIRLTADHRNSIDSLSAALERPQVEQEPVAWLTIEVMGPRTKVDVEWEDQLQKLPSGIYKLYTKPQRKIDESGKPDEWFDRLKSAHSWK